MILDPILAETGVLTLDEAEELRSFLENKMQLMSSRIEALQGGFDFKKKVTSAVRRFLPNGQANEIGFSVNLRALRHTVQMRTSRHAEWEIRQVFHQVYHLCKDRFPLLFHGAVEELVRGAVEVSGMRMQPYETVAG